MSSADWHERWAAGRIGFHEPEVNALLADYWPGLDAGPRVLVPLCGKSIDLLWLAERGHDVIGVELVTTAVEQFFTEARLTPVVDTVAAGRRFTAGNIVIYAADMFDLGRDEIGVFDAVYDRAALVALPAEVRPRYVRHLTGLLGAPATGLLVTMEYDQTRMSGPPFAVAESEVMATFGQALDVATLYSNPTALEHNPKFAERGLPTLTERVYRLTTR